MRGTCRSRPTSSPTRARPDADGTVTDSYEFATTNVRIGLTNNAEINFVWQPYGSLRTHQIDPIGTFRDSGIGGFDIRGKVNLWGNDTFDRTVLHWPCYPSSPCLPTTTTASALSTPRAA